jgi:DNA-binding beta-propeller fold protein YncE
MNTLLLSGVIVIGSLGAAGNGQLMKHVQTVPLEGIEGRFDHFSMDIQAKRLFVAALGANKLVVIDLAAGERISSVEGLKMPTGVRVIPGSRNVVVASGDDGKLRVYSPDLKLLKTVDGLDDADNVRLDADGKLAYVGYSRGAIAVIDTQLAKKIADFGLDGHPEAFQLETTGTRIFVNVPAVNQVVVIDRQRQAIIEKWPIRDAEANFPMALDEGNHRLFIGCRKPGKLLVVDTESGKTVAAMDCCGDTDDLFYDAGAKRIYLTGGDGCINIFAQSDADHYRLLGTVDTAPGARTSLFVPEIGRLYVAVPHRGNQPAEIRAYQPLP